MTTMFAWRGRLVLAVLSDIDAVPE